MSMGGSQPEVLTTLTTDFGKVLDGIHRTKIRGSAHLSTALNVAQVSARALEVGKYKLPPLTTLAQLALKHRQNKSQHQRIIVFTCSPLSEDEKTCIKLAKRLKKSSIAVDVIAFGDLDADTVKKIEAFHDNIKGSSDDSNLAIIPPGPNLLSDSIVATPILASDGLGGMGVSGTRAGGAGGGGEGGAGGDDGAFEFGIDPNTDPELALALRMSMEEETRRQQRQEQETRDKEGKTALEAVPEGDEKGGPGSSGGSGGGGEGSSGQGGSSKDADPNKMDTA